MAFSAFQCFRSHPTELDATQCKKLQLFCPLSSSPFHPPLSPLSHPPPFSLSKNFHLNENPASVFCCAPRGGGVQLVRICFEVDQCEHASRPQPRPRAPPPRLPARRVIGCGWEEPDAVLKPVPSAPLQY